MAYEFLKKLFGNAENGEPKALTYEELESAIDADKNINLVNLKEGGYVSKEKFDAKDTELKGVQAQLNTANDTIKGFEGQDIDGIKQKVSEWENKYNADTQALKDQLDAQARSHAEEMFLSGYKFTSKAARNGVLSELRAKNLAVSEGTILGGKEFIQGLMDNEDYKGAFVAPETNNDDGNGDNNGNSGNNGSQNNGNIYAGQNKPIFSSGTNGGASMNNDDAPKFDFGFNRIRQPEPK